jgi:MFS family permease
MAAPAEPDRPRDEPERSGPPSPLELLQDRRAVIDTGLGPVAFVVVNAIWGLHPAAYVALALAVLVAVERLVRRKPVTNAIGGVFGTGLAVFIALRSGEATGYFVPRMIYAAALAVLLAGSAVIRRPLLGYLVQALYRMPAEWVRHRGVRRASQELTFAWSGLFALRAVVYAVLIAAGSVGALAAASVVMGWPAFGLLLFISYRFLPLRLKQLGAPVPHAG